MINLLASGLLSICLLSPAQSPDCAGDIGVSTPPVDVSVSSPLPLPEVPLPLPLPPVVIDPPPLPPSLPPIIQLPPVLDVPPVVIIPKPVPQPLPPVVKPPVVAPPAPHPPVPSPTPQQPAPHPVPAPVPAPAPAPQPVEVKPAAPATSAPKPAPAQSHAPQTLQELTGPSIPELKPEPLAEKPNHRAPFDDGSVISGIGNTLVEFPDFGYLLLLLAGIGIAVLNQKLDGSPKPRKVGRHSHKLK